MEIKIPLDSPNIGALEKEYVLRALESGYVSSVGPLVSKFEERFASCLGSKYAVAVVNGTSGLHLALRALNIGPGDEVIVPALTFIATVNPVLYVGATPVVVDVSPDTWTIDPVKIERAVTGKTRAIIPVHLYGNPASMKAINDIAKRHHLYVIEDATEALGSSYNGKAVGTLGRIGVFSFNGNKVITTGGGGMLVTDDTNLADRLRLLVNQGRRQNLSEYEHEEVGYNYRLTNLQASLGLAQLERLGEFIRTKKAISRIYRDRFEGIPGLSWQHELSGAQSNWWLFSLLLDEAQFKEDRTHLMARLWSKGIQVRPLFKPMPGQPCYRSFKFKQCETADRLHAAGLNLPSATFLTADQVEEVCTAVLGGN